MICVTHLPNYDQCYVTGIERTRCSINQASRTRQCNLWDQNCRWCVVDGNNREELEAVCDSVGAWCNAQDGVVKGGLEPDTEERS